VRRQLESVAGVEKVVVDYDAKTATCTFDEEGERPELVAALQGGLKERFSVAGVRQ